MWNQAYLESKILSADPVELVQILYQAALDAVRDARHHLANGEIAARSSAISKAIAILVELSSSLNHQQGGEVSRNLAELYDYMQRRLLEANLKQADGPLAEVSRLLTTLSEAWHGVKLQTHQAGNPGVEEASPDGPDPAYAGSVSPTWASRFVQEPAAPAPPQGWSL